MAMLSLSPQRRPLALAAVIVLVTGVAVLGGAWALETFANVIPCQLCLQQRQVYYFGLPLTAVALVWLFSAASPGVPRVLMAVIGILFVGGAGLAAYHAGVEWHWWPGPTSCATGGGSAESAAGLVQQMQRTRVVPCDVASWRFLGLSLAGYNMLISLAVVALIAWAIRASLRRA
jgi:disulfide bond formation protein DsbB